MSLLFRCPSCGRRFRLAEAGTRQTVRCPADSCGTRLKLRPRRTSLVPHPRQPPVAESSRSVVRPVAMVLVFGVLLGVAGWLLVESRLTTNSVVASEPAESPAADQQPERTNADLDSLAAGVARRVNRTGRPAVLTSLDLQQEQQTARQQDLDEKLLPFLNTYCIDCHGPDTELAGITVHELTSVDQILPQRKSWERVYRMINAGAMPPSDHDPRPEPEESQVIAELLHRELYEFDCSQIDNPGRPTVQRLNRAEYNNTIQDLFGIDLTPADDFPSDDVGEGFDNIGDVLSLPPLLMEKYLNAAEQVVSAVIDTRDYSVAGTVRRNAEDLTSSRNDNHISNQFRRMITSGTLSAEFQVQAAGNYEIRLEVAADQAGDEKARFALEVNEDKVHEYRISEHQKPRTFTHQVSLQPGSVRVGAKFLNDFYDAKAADKNHRDRNLAVKFIELIGPIGGGQPAYSELHRRIVTAVPGDSLTVSQAAAQVLEPLLFRIFRRPLKPGELDRYCGLVQQVVDEMDETYEQGLSLAVQAALVSPDFLFRLEQDPAPGQTERQLDDFELASRLSYFLWSSMPDEQLFDLARQGRLNQPQVLQQQIRRMLQHPRAAALVSNFASQWLNLRNLDEVSPNPDVFGDFSDDLRADMRRETELLFETVMKEDRSIEDLLAADFTFVNGRLARHYGIPGIDGDDFTRVSLTGVNRAGVLTHASILTLTSNPGRTSPVKRGKWIMENIFGEAPPPPPPDVPELEETAKATPGATLREQLAKHREDPGCASCHQVMDPLGLGLENFDGIGRWRDTDEGKPIDASGSLPSGESFDGPLQLVEIVKSRREQFYRTMTEKMLVYSLGRGTDYYDKCAVDKCLQRLQQNGQRFSALVEGIVLSDPFQKRSAPPSTGQEN